MTRSKLIHILGGSLNQIPLIKAAQALGHRVLVTDMNTVSPATAIADFYQAINITDKEATLEAARKHKINAIISDQSDVAVPTIAYVARQLDLPGITEQLAELFTNKRAMKDKLVKSLASNIPKYFYCETYQQALDHARELLQSSQAIIVKPIDNQGSKGVVKIEKPDELEKSIKIAFAHSKIGGILVEEFIGGEEYAVETVVQNSKVKTLAVSRKYHYTSCDYLDQKVVFPSDLSQANEDSLKKLNEQIIITLGLENGLTHAEYKLDQRGFYLMEIAARGAGSGVSSTIIPYLTGFDTSKYLIKLSLGEESEIKINDFHKKNAVLEFIDINDIKCNKQGIVKEVLITDSAKDIAHQIFIDQSKINLTINNSNDRCGYMIVFSDKGKDDIQDKISRIKSNIRIEYE